MQQIFSIGECPFCHQGSAEIVKDVINNELLIMCSECGTIWDSPHDFYDNKPNVYKMKIIKKVVDAISEEIDSKGWKEFTS